MNKNKYNIEEVFKSELEDFEIDLPKNLWSNVSNNLTSHAAVGKAGLFSSKLFTIAVSIASTAIIGGIFIFSNVFKNKNEKLPQEKSENLKEIEVQVITAKDDRLPNNTIKEVLIEKVKIDPIIEKVKQEENTTPRQYIINNNTEGVSVLEVKPDINDLSNLQEKVIISTTPPAPPSDKIEVIEVKPTDITATISASPIGGYAPLTINFSHSNNNVNTSWNFKDGNRSNQKDISHTFEKQGVYNIELTVTNELGQSSTTTKTITILSTSNISNIPNIFTPNNDNINDLFIIKHENIKSFNLYIYSKKGELIYETNDIYKGWNGNTQYEEKSKSGDYIYIIKASGIDGKIFEEKGVVKLAR